MCIRVSRTSRLRNRHGSVDQGQQRYRRDQLSHDGFPELGALTIMVTGISITRGGKPHVSFRILQRAGLSAGLVLARSEGFEPPALGIEIRCSIQLSYERVSLFNTLAGNLSA
jgi:hypothetical protein